MTALPRRSALLLFLGASLAGCASAEPDYYRLSPQPSAAGAAPPARAPRMVELRRVGLARYLDRSEIVRGGGGAKLEVLEGERWAEPLGDMLGRVLAENLTLRLPGSTVFVESSALSLQGEVTVEVEILRFEADAAGAVTLSAQLALRPEGRAERRPARAFTTSAPVSGTGTAALVSAMNTALAALADAVVEMLRR
jgi:uncharacterized lipoprotein YmbA